MYWIRHGETDFNKKGIVQGGGVDSSLNTTGIKQALHFYHYYKQHTFDAIYSSKLKRTQETLAPWSQNRQSYQILDGIEELSWGVHEGLIPNSEQREEFLTVRKKWAEGMLDLTVTGGETPLEAWERTREALKHLFEKHIGQQILVCSHGRILKIMLSALLDQDIAKMDTYPQPNTGLHILEFDTPETARAIKLADIAHLESDEIQTSAVL